MIFLRAIFIIKLLSFSEFYDVRRLGSYARKGKEAERRDNEKKKREKQTRRGESLNRDFH